MDTPLDFLKINVDAAVGNSAIAFAMVVRNQAGNLVFLASCISEPLESYLAELKALTWAVNHACEFGWTNVIWCSDAKNVIKEVGADTEPIGWKSRDDLLLIK